jgi:hypothetical protein
MKLFTANNRTETRLNKSEFELINFKLNSLVIDAIIEDVSNNGMGCFCSLNSPIKVGDTLNLWDIVLYKVCWINKLSKTVKNFGLLIVKEF